MKQKLLIQDFEVMVNLGSTPEEQLAKQPVHFTLTVSFERPVAACDSDQLHDTVDYVELTQIMTAVATIKNYFLIEHLNQQVLEDLLSYLRNKQLKGIVSLAVKKILVPIENLRNGVVFSCEITL